jgi:hypothetical protein
MRSFITCISPDIVRAMISRRMRLGACNTDGDMRNSQNIFVGKKWEHNIGMDLKEIG